MSKKLTNKEILAIDAGTQGISIILWCPERKLSLGVGDADYEQAYIPNLPDGHLEQYPYYWTNAMVSAMKKLRIDVEKNTGKDISTVAAIGVTGHMHCMVTKTDSGKKPYGCDMWNDPRGVPESEELAILWDEHIPARWTAAHILSAMRRNPEMWSTVTGVNVTSGSLVHDLTDEWVIGPGDASGMFGVLDQDGQIDQEKLQKMDDATGNIFTPLRKLVPQVIPAGQVAGTLNAKGAKLLGGLPTGIPIAAPEGDQQSVLIGAAAAELELALSAGTSFTGNLPSTKQLKAEGETINVLHTPDMLTMLMICARNGTVGFANYVAGLSNLTGASFKETADKLTDLAAALPPDAYGTELLPFFQGEIAVNLPNAKASIHNAGIELLANPGLMARLLLEAPCMTMRYGIEQLRPKIGNLRKVILTGGALKSKGGYAPQLYADILSVPVTAKHGNEEGTAKGAAILAAYMLQIQEGNSSQTLAAFAKSQSTGKEQTWQPDPDMVKIFDKRYKKFEALVTTLNNQT